MLDPVSAIGVAAAIDQFVATTATIVHNLSRYYEKVRSASAHSADLRKELSLLTSILIDAKLLFEENPDAFKYTSIENVLDNLIDVMNELTEHTKPNETQGLYKKLAWPFKQNENEIIIAKIERFKADLSLCLETANG